MQILNANQIRAWDKYTIENEPVSSIDLMERAALKCAEWIIRQQWQDWHFKIFCGKGNNGGDGLAIARMLLQKGYSVSIYILEFGKLGSEDFQQNLQRLHELPFADIHFIQQEENFPSISKQDVVVDALFGSGLNQPLDGLSAALVNQINCSEATVVSIDLPSGLFLDQSSLANTVVKATHTLSFQCHKLGLLVQENASFVGDVHILDIGLHPEFLNTNPSYPELVDAALVKDTLYKPRNRFAHKGHFGHSLIVAGSYGKMGAAILATKACVKSGSGLTTAFIPRCGYDIMQISAPEAMVITGENDEEISSLPDDIEKYTSIGVGPGIGTKEDTQKTLSFIVRRYKKSIIIDADGLNCLSLQPDLLSQLPPYSIITPHPKEFERLFGEGNNDFGRIETAKKKAVELKIIIVLKSHHTLIALPDGRLFFNSTGNAGMAKGGSGDVLTGILCALLSQGYSPENAAVFGVYLHGFAGDLAAKALSEESMTATDVINFLPQAFLHLTTPT